MSVSVNPAVNPTQCSFKGKMDRTEQGVPYYKTNSAMKIGGTLAGIGAVMTTLQLCGHSTNDKLFKNSVDEIGQRVAKARTKQKKQIIAQGLVSLATTLGCAAFIDHKRNEKAKEIANYTSKVGTRNAIMNNDDVSLSNKGRAYYDSNVGSKYGGWLGAGIAAVTSAVVAKPVYKEVTEAAALDLEISLGRKLTSAEIKAGKQGGKVGLVVGTIGAIGVAALGGWLLGKWSDSIANKDARKHA